MKKMSKTRNKENLLPFHIIKAASEGDVSAINAVLKHYEGYIIKLLSFILGLSKRDNCSKTIIPHFYCF